MRLAWLTDIHLNFVDESACQKYYQEIINTQCDGVLISGDIAEAPCLVDILNEMADRIKKPIYFILGNHDYYKGQIDEVRDAMRVLTQMHEKLFWLPASGGQQLSKDTFLIGQDGWADGRLGDYQNSRAVLNDSRMIADLFQEKIMGKFQLLEKMRQLADVDAMQLKNDLEQMIMQYPKKVIVLTHVPPFKEACLHMGEISNDDWLPYFSSKAVGDVLMRIAQENSGIEFFVLCGHTHSEAEYRPIHNLTVNVGSAEYQNPKIQKIIYV
ncbi:MAG: metallophosphoesterase [Gammaproteobacteria bacterium]